MNRCRKRFCGGQDGNTGLQRVILGIADHKPRDIGDQVFLSGFHGPPQFRRMGLFRNRTTAPLIRYVGAF